MYIHCTSHSLHRRFLFKVFLGPTNKLVVHANQGQFGSEKIYTPSNAFISNLQSITNISTLFYVVLLSTGGLIPYFPVQYLEK